MFFLAFNLLFPDLESDRAVDAFVVAAFVEDFVHVGVEVVTVEVFLHILWEAEEERVVGSELVFPFDKGFVSLVGSSYFVTEVQCPVCGEESSTKFCHKLRERSLIVRVSILGIPRLNLSIDKSWSDSSDLHCGIDGLEGEEG